MLHSTNNTESKIMSAINIRRAVPGDLAVLLEFEQGLIEAERPFNPLLKPTPVHYYDLGNMLADPEIIVAVAETGGELIGCGYAKITAAKPFYNISKQGYLGMMFIVPGYRGLSVNHLIISYLTAELKQKGITELILEVFSSNRPAIKAYEKAGFEPHIMQMRKSVG